jgi:hypothetical protein
MALLSRVVKDNVVCESFVGVSQRMQMPKRGSIKQFESLNNMWALLVQKKGKGFIFNFRNDVL